MIKAERLKILEAAVHVSRVFLACFGVFFKMIGFSAFSAVKSLGKNEKVNSNKGMKDKKRLFLVETLKNRLNGIDFP